MFVSGYKIYPSLRFQTLEIKPFFSLVISLSGMSAGALRASGTCLNLTCGWAVAVCLPHSSSLCFLDMLQCTLSNKVVFSSQFSLSCFRHLISATQHSPGIFAENATFSGYILTSRLRFHTICLY